MRYDQEFDCSLEGNIPFSPLPDDYIQPFIDEVCSDEDEFGELI